MTDLTAALWISLVGMGVVFSAILLLWGMISLLSRWTALPRPMVVAEPPSEADERRSAEQAAVTAVAVALAWDAPGRPRPFPLPPTAIVSAWQAVQRGATLRQRGPVR
jgi:Na+-transporting methylmalonyl-CoA/oxaloacetate decarboxylase gamma subunit